MNGNKGDGCGCEDGATWNGTICVRPNIEQDKVEQSVEESVDDLEMGKPPIEGLDDYSEVNTDVGVKPQLGQDVAGVRLLLGLICCGIFALGIGVVVLILVTLAKKKPK